ncbi:MAG TPA: hypothetical protein PK971_08385 [Saprospiraceae bacterium]|nr:hypothetical protein [Saprospiraceae bacterium]HND88332.1 hypothetical protein [Saprospiraceae bacterium]HNG90860.1 hypothetical protein [Saprospiraceae bacterium]
MSKFLLKGIIAGAVLLAFSYLSLYVVVSLFPNLAEQYYDPMFSLEGNKAILFFLHPFVLSFALAWFWRRFKGLFHGPFWWRGLEMGIMYGLIATLPAMWMIFSAMSLSLSMVATWLLYGIVQAVVVGMVFAKISP